MIKDGQIEMLQKIITNRYSPKESINSNSQYVNQLASSEKQDFYKSDKQKGVMYVADDKISSMETILL